MTDELKATAEAPEPFDADEPTAAEVKATKEADKKTAAEKAKKAKADKAAKAKAAKAKAAKAAKAKAAKAPKKAPKKAAPGAVEAFDSPEPTAEIPRVEIGPLPLVANHSLDITAKGFQPSEMVRISIEPEGTTTGVKMMKTDQLGRFQTAIIPVAGSHRVVVESRDGKAKVVRDFEVAAG